MEKQKKDRKLNCLPKLSGRRHPPSEKVPVVRGYKVTTFKRKYGNATKSFDAWFRSQYGE